MECKAVQRRLTEYICDDLLPHEKQDIEQHIAACESCRKEARSIEGTRALLSKWSDAEVPEGLHEKLLALKARRRKGLLSFIPAHLADFLWSSVFPTAAGFAVALVVLVMTVSYMDDVHISNWSLLLCGLVWGEVYHSIFQKVFSPFNSRSRFSTGNAKFIFAGVLCFLFAFFLAMITPNPMPFETREFFFPIAKHLPYSVAYLLPFIWSIVAVAATGTVLSKMGRCSLRKLWIVAAVHSLLMLLDLITYTIFDPFATATMLLIWTAGVALGSVMGIFIAHLASPRP